jgi:hypothetical protein
MAQLPPHTDVPRTDVEAEPTTAAPRWVKAFGLVAVVVVVLVVMLMLVGGGNHGPGRHTGSGAPAGPALPVSNALQSAAHRLAEGSRAP